MATNKALSEISWFTHEKTGEVFIDIEDGMSNAIGTISVEAAELVLDANYRKKIKKILAEIKREMKK